MAINNPLDRLVAFAEADENIRAVLLEGSRAHPDATVDEWSDYDVAFVRRSNEPYLRAEWFAAFASEFGEIAILQTPDDPELFDGAHDPLEHYAYLVQYMHRLRLDLTFDTRTYLQSVTREGAIVVLLDKDGDFPALKQGERDYCVRLPDRGPFRGCCNEFWWTTLYVGKAIARGQAIAAVELLDKVVRPQFSRMLTWLAAVNGGPATTVGKYGTNLAAHVPVELSGALLASYTRADLAEIQSALHELVRAFPSTAQQVADALGYVYDAREGERARAYLACHFER